MEPSYKLCETIADASGDEAAAHEWQRYLPGDAISIVSRLEHDRALLNFFSFFSNWQIRVMPHLFVRDLGSVTKRVQRGESYVQYQWAGSSTGAARGKKLNVLQHYSPLTHNAMLSVALAYSDSEDLRSRRVREKFAQHAKRFLESECQAPTLSTVQGLAILSSFHAGFGEQSKWFLPSHIDLD